MNSGRDKNVQAELIALYTRLAEQPDSAFGWRTGKANARQLDYSESWLNLLPDVVWESAAAVGNPFKLGAISPGQTILDIGCGAGADACIAALQVGKTGKVVGVDCTQAMVDKALNNARLTGLNNIVFLKADFASLPVAKHSVDVVISNGAINLAENKVRVFQELYRVLKPGSRLQIADMVRAAGSCCPAPDTESWADCIQGTLLPGKLLEIINRAGFTDADIVELTGYKTSISTNGALICALRP